MLASRSGHDVRRTGRNGCSQRKAQFGVATRERVYGPVRRHSFPRSGLSGRGAFRDPVTRVVDDERRRQFMQEGAHFETEYFLALTYLPPVEAEERVKGWMSEGTNSDSSR
jgi:hypothetical protein